MDIQNQYIMRFGGLSVAAITRQWMSTLDYQAVYYDPQVDPAARDFQGPAVFILWHEYIPLLFYLRSHCNVAMLVSKHQDAEWLSQAARQSGFETIRGSTRRGGVAALRELMRTGRSMSITMTPDGPIGPRRRLTAGCIYLSSRLGIPLVPIGLGYDRPWRYRRAWDQFAVPRPGSRARVVSGPKVSIPPDLDRAGVEHYRLRVEQLLNRLTTTAEQWAESNCRYEGQRPVTRRGSPRRNGVHSEGDRNGSA